MKKYMKGYTLAELIIVVGGIGAIVVIGFIIYVLIHFIAKVW